jgi:hypothetical protein
METLPTETALIAVRVAAPGADAASATLPAYLTGHQSLLGYDESYLADEFFSMPMYRRRGVKLR